KVPTLDVDGLTFTFPPDWNASKYDEWVFYRNQFAKQRDGIAAVDVVAISPAQDAYLVEVKDYRHPQTEKPSRLPDAIANKVLCTLSALLPASLRATDVQERQISQRLLQCRALSVVVHIEQPRAHKPAVDVADVKQS